MDKLKKSEGRKKATYSMHHSAYLEMNWQHILFQKHNYGDLVIFDLRDERSKIF